MAQAAGATSGIGQPGLRQHAGGDTADRELRSDRDVDLAGQHDQRHRRARRPGPAGWRERDRSGSRRRNSPGAATARTAASAAIAMRDGDLAAVTGHDCWIERHARAGSCPPSPPRAARMPAIVPRAHHGDPVAHAENLRQLRRDHEDRQPALGQILDQRVNLRLRSDVHALRRLVEDRARTAGSRASGPARPSAGCRPRARALRSRPTAS